MPPKCLPACLLAYMLACMLAYLLACMLACPRLEPPLDSLECCRNSFRAILSIMSRTQTHEIMTPDGAQNTALDTMYIAEKIFYYIFYHDMISVHNRLS